uniref:Uncharacterized protein n=1 Tax=Tetradesmus obliquus TaxID=3088 RepID=A0A383V6R1_TETOB
MVLGSFTSSVCSSRSSSASSSSYCCYLRPARRVPGTHLHRQQHAVYLLLLMAGAALLGQAADGRRPSAAKPEREGCIVDDYEQLLNVTSDYSSCGGNGDNAHIFLSCNSRWFTRGALPALTIEHDQLETAKHEPSVHILPESDCGVITIEVDLALNPQLPLLTVHGDVGIHKFEMNNVRFVVKGANASAVMPVCTSRPCQATALIDIHDVEHVTLTNVTVTSQQPAQPGGAWQQLPYTGITIKSLSGGVPIVNLDAVIVAKMVDGVTVVGGGNLSATNLRSSHNHNMGLYYMCSMVQQSSLVVAGRSTISNNGGLGTPVQEGEDERGVGIHIDCDGDFITLDASISGNVTIAGNSRHGILVDGHVHAEVGPGVRLHGNGGNATLCGGGLHAHFLYGSPAVKVQGVKFVNNTAQYGAGACIEIPEEAKPLVGKINGEFSLLSDVSFMRNRATVCGGAFATVVSPSKSRVNVLVPDGAGHSFTENTAPAAHVWCAMPVYGNDYMAISL